MKHHTNPAFWSHYDRLEPEIRRLADKNFALLKADPLHPSLRFKRVGRLWSARVGLNHRALCVRRDDDCVWFWIGTHAEYDRLIG
ncbi:hypothetical protein PZ895_01760 [Mesorhizobium sp. YIM 152430]|uniref:ParE family toxin-like protein n=1 Tax=Mesorhizobium sp. YIM 152430 TaxID=3031761 RepID=UPI0023DAC0BC|nr:hypothetical protein [Mesorhizobium sp. YIM 152430]MDF1598498.1 hypothetical protein [Mesorhizobium sp. YIM 152430]